MAQKVGDITVAITSEVDDKALIYNTLTEETKLLDPKNLVDSVDNIIHTDKPSEIDSVIYKPSPVATDIVLIEDSEDSFNKKKIPLSTLGGGAGGIPDAPVDSKVYARKDGNWVDPNINLMTSRIIWEPPSPPQYQLCLVDNTPQVITYTDYTLMDSRLSVNLLLGEITVLEDLLNIDLHVNLQIIRESGTLGSAEWGACAEVWDGLTWIPYPDSTRYFTFNREIDQDIRHLCFSISFTDITAGTKFRLVQACSDVSKTIGLLSSKPFTLMPQGAGVLLTINTR